MSFWGKSNAQAAAELAAGIQEVKTVKNMRKNIFALKDRLANSAEFSQDFYTLIQDVSRPPKLMSCTTVGTIASEEWRPAENNYEPFSTIKIENPNYNYEVMCAFMLLIQDCYPNVYDSPNVTLAQLQNGATGDLIMKKKFLGKMLKPKSVPAAVEQQPQQPEQPQTQAVRRPAQEIRQDVMYCPNCGNPHPVSAKYCSKCGNQF